MREKSLTLPAAPRGKPTVIHINGPRLKESLSSGGTLKLHVIRVIHASPNLEYHCDTIDIHGPSWMKTQWDRPLRGYPSAVCVLQTRASVTLGWIR